MKRMRDASTVSLFLSKRKNVNKSFPSITSNVIYLSPFYYKKMKYPAPYE